jgi:hypothetical protein
MKEKANYWNSLLNAFEVPPICFEDMVFKKYIELQSVKKVADYLNNNGYSKEGEKVYTSSDISGIIQVKTCPANVEEVIYKTAKEMFLKAKKFTQRF